MELVKTFLFAYFQVFAISINVYFISISNLTGVFISSFIINTLWMLNVNRTSKKITILYPTGASLGAISGVILGSILSRSVI